MSEDLHFDAHAKKQFGQYEADVPRDMWNRIAAEREKRKPRGFWAAWTSRTGLLVLTGCLLTAAGVAWWLQSQHPVTTGNLAAVTAAPAPLATSQPTATPQATTADNLPAASPAATSPIQDDHSASTNMLLAAPGSARPATPPYSPLNNESVRRSAAGQPSGSRNSSTIKPASVLNNDNNRSNGDPEVTVDAPDVVNPVYTAGEQNSNPEWQGARFNTSTGKLSHPLPDMSGLRDRLLGNVTVPGCPKIEDDAAANKTYIELYAGPDMASRSLRSFADTASANYLQKRKETTKFQSAFSIGLRYTRVFNNGMSLRSGINYSQINEKFTYINPRDIRYVIVITPREVTQPNGTVITVYDSLRYVQTGTRKKVTYNRYRSIDIPLQLGYELGNGRLHTNISAGAMINVYSWQKGDILDANGEPVSITTGKSSSMYGFKTNIGVSFLGSVSLYYKLNDRWHLMAEPYFRYSFSPMSKEALNLTQKYNTLGLRLGIRLDF